MNPFRLGRTSVLLALIAQPGCSAFLEFETSQCQKTSDCQALGPSFAGLECRSGSCLAPLSSVGSNPGAGGGGGEGGDQSNPDGCVSNAQCVKDNLGEIKKSN